MSEPHEPSDALTVYLPEAARAEWTAAFVAAQAKLGPIVKNREVNTGSYHYRYADLPSIIEAVRGVLTDHGLAFAQSVVEGPGVITRIYHSAGHVEEFGPVKMPAGGNAQAVGSAISYARRYGLTSALGLAVDDDDDGRSAGASPAQDVSAPLGERRTHYGSLNAGSGERGQSAPGGADTPIDGGGKPQDGEGLGIPTVNQIAELVANLGVTKSVAVQRARKDGVDISTTSWAKLTEEQRAAFGAWLRGQA